MLELQKYLRFQDNHDKRRKTMDYTIRFLIKNYEEQRKR